MANPSMRAARADDQEELVDATMAILRKAQSFGLRRERELRVLIAALGVLALEAGISKERLLACLGETYDVAKLPRSIGDA